MPHIHDKIDFTASAFVVCGDKVLLRYHDKHNKWLNPGGHIELDEDPIETVLKEIKEETGLNAVIVADPIPEFLGSSDEVDTGKSLPVPLSMNRHRISDTHEHIDLRYVAKADSMEIHPQEGENSNPENFKWVTAEELKGLSDVSEQVKYEALEALKKVNS